MTNSQHDCYVILGVDEKVMKDNVKIRRINWKQMSQCHFFHLPKSMKSLLNDTGFGDYLVEKSNQ